MTIEERPWREGVRRTGPIASITAVSTATLVFSIAAARTGIIRKLHIANNNAAPNEVQIGDTIGAFVQRIPSIYVPANQDIELGEDVLQDWEFDGTNDIIAQVVGGAAAAPNDVQIQVTVEEFQSATG